MEVLFFIGFVVVFAGYILWPEEGIRTVGGPVIDAAFKRALLGGFLVALSTFFVMLPQTDDWKLLLSAVGGGFVGVLISRLGIEGSYDLNRANHGNVSAGDVPMASNKVDVVKR